MINLVGMTLSKVLKLIDRFICRYELSKFKKVGENCYIDGKGTYSSENITLGDNVYLGANNIFISSKAEINIGSNVMFGPHVIAITGDHRFDVLGKYMIEVKEKKSKNDKDIIIEDDVWIGAGTIILKGVRIGRGSIVGAGSIVSKNIPNYSIYYGNNNIKRRFTDNEIFIHEKILNEVKGSNFI